MADNKQGLEEQQDYLSYLLRLWQVKTGGRAVWRASLECPHTGELQGFADLEALCGYLRGETQQEGGGASHP